LRQGGRQLARIRHLQGGALLQQQPRNVLAVRIIRSGQHRNPQRRGLQQIVAADGHQAAADEGRIGRCIQCREFPHRIHQQDLGGGVRRRAGAAPREAPSSTAQ